MDKNRENIKNLTFNQINSIVEDLAQPLYRANQIINAVYKDRVQSFEEITTLPKELRQSLDEKFTFGTFESVKRQVSSDGSVKFLFKLPDGNSIESVYMPWLDDAGELVRSTLCISSQVGCALGCKFCATGTLGLKRNLLCSEIIDQIFEVERILGKKIDNIVFMGMGEPLQNLDNVLKAIEILVHDDIQILGRKRITVSTSGIIPKIYELGRTEKPVKLAISLHATSNGIRNKIMPKVKRWGLSELMDAVEFYYRRTKLPITFEYIPFKGVNDSDLDAQRIAKLLKRIPSKVNLIPFNDISFTNADEFSRSLKPLNNEEMKGFAAKIRENGGTVIIRDTFGDDIDAACGQLALSDKIGINND